MNGKELSYDQQAQMVIKQLSVLREVDVPVRWMSIEPLSFDIAPYLQLQRLDWVVIGAATNGRKTYQPRREWMEALLQVMEYHATPVFFKGNLEWEPWREEFPRVGEVKNG